MSTTDRALARDSQHTQESPSVRLARCGASALTDAELVSLYLATNPTAAHVTRATEALTGYSGSVASLLASSCSSLPPVARARIAGVMELARRALASEMRARDSLTSPGAVRGYLRLQMQTLTAEAFWAVAVDAQNRVIEARELFRGTLTQTSVYPREVVKFALAVNAAALILCHNHPSGVAEPSLQDQALTRTLSEALALIDVKVLDHFIVAPGACMSFAERGLI